MFCSRPMAPDLSIIIPVLYEGPHIQACLTHVAQVAQDLNTQTTNYEVIVVDGDPQGSTLSYLPHQENIQGIQAAQGRGSQMNAGARLAQGRLLLFLHADTILPEQAFQQILAVCEDGTTVGGAFDLEIASSRLFLKVISKVSSWRSQLTRIPYGDQAIFVRRDIFEVVQGFPDIPIMEDVALMQRLKQGGYAIRILRSPAIVSPRRWEQEGIVRCTLRNWSLMTLYVLGVDPQKLAYWYRPLSAIND
jgi:uncharacterized protein